MFNPLILAGLLLQNDDAGGIIALFTGGFGLICWLVVIILIVAGFWKTFEKAGHPGWAAIIPIYNLYILMLVAGRPGWWLILYFIPFVNIIIPILIGIDVAKAFGKDTLYGILLLWLFMPIGFLLLGFGDATYAGTGASAEKSS